MFKTAWEVLFDDKYNSAHLQKLFRNISYLSNHFTSETIVGEVPNAWRDIVRQHCISNIEYMQWFREFVVHRCYAWT